MNKNSGGWKENFFDLNFSSKFLFQSSLYAVNISDDINGTEKVIKTFDNREIFVSGPGFSQFDLMVASAVRKLVSKYRKSNCLPITMTDIIHAMGRYDGGRTRQQVLESLKRAQNLHVGYDFSDGTHFAGCRLKVKELKQNEFIVTWNDDYLSATYSHTNDLICTNINKIFNLPVGLQSWLYCFFCATSELRSIDIDLLHKLSGSNYKSQNDFRKAVKIALAGLERRQIIDWQHGITRHGLVFWKNKNLL